MNKLTILVLLGLLFTFSFAAITNCAVLNDAEGTEEAEEAAEGEEAAEEGTEGEEEVVEARRLATETCKECDSGYGLAESDTKCNQCKVDNCGNCDTLITTCDECKEGFFRESSTKCTKCDDTNCAVCATKDTCSECKKGYSRSYEDGETEDAATCTACANGCADCDNIDGTCTSCPTGVGKNTTNGVTVCCSANCEACADAKTCTKCYEKFVLNDENAQCIFGFKTGASLTLGAIVSVALFSLFF